MNTSDVAFILLSLLFSAFFSGMEIAFVSSNKLKVELDKKTGNIPARILSHFVESPSRFIGTMLVGNNIALVVYGIVMAKVLEPVIELYTHSEISILAIQTVISTLLVLITAEFIPKTIFRINPNWILNVFAVPAGIVYVLLYPVVFVTIGLSELILKVLFRVELEEGKPVFRRTDLDEYLKEATSSIDEEEELEHEVQILQNALEFSEVKARECMIPRTEIVAFDLNSSIDELREKFVETGLSKILIYRGSIDNIIGYTHSYELFKKPEKIKQILLPISIVPETMLAHEVLELFIKSNRSVCVVVDEFGGTSGMLTLEDVVEEIFGEIEDEHDVESLEEVQLSETEFDFSARLEIDYLNEKYKLNLPESEDYETIAGLIISLAESIPEENEKIYHENFIFKIKAVSNNKIESIYLKIKEE